MTSTSFIVYRAIFTLTDPRKLPIRDYDFVLLQTDRSKKSELLCGIELIVRYTLVSTSKQRLVDTFVLLWLTNLLYERRSEATDV